MNDWNEGYITDVDYTYGFYKEMAPAAIRFALLAAGYESPPVDRFSYCELGYGQGAARFAGCRQPGGDLGHHQPGPRRRRSLAGKRV
jgi:hypothetical protein